MTTNKPRHAFIPTVTILLILSFAYSLAAHPHSLIRQNTPAAPAQQPDIHTLPAVGLQYELPQGWKAENQSNGNVFLSLEDGACNVTFVFDENYTEVVEGMKSGLKEKLTEMKFDGPAKESTHNGMKHISETGTGMMEGLKITFSIDVLKATKPVTLLTFGIEEVFQKHISEYEKFVGSLKKS